MSTLERQIPIHAPMNQFAVQDGELVVGGKRLSTLAAQVGQTPFYAYDRALIKAARISMRGGI